jgi:hypothetical protein
MYFCCHRSYGKLKISLILDPSKWSLQARRDWSGVTTKKPKPWCVVFLPPFAVVPRHPVSASSPPSLTFVLQSINNCRRILFDSRTFDASFPVAASSWRPPASLCGRQERMRKTMTKKAPRMMTRKKNQRLHHLSSVIKSWPLGRVESIYDRTFSKYDIRARAPLEGHHVRPVLPPHSPLTCCVLSPFQNRGR